LTRRALVVLVSFAAIARAQSEVPEVAWISIAPCESSTIESDELLARLRTELSSDGVTDVRALAPGEAPPEETGRVALIQLEASPCEEGSAAFVIRIDDLVTAKRVERTVDLTRASAAGRARALALAVAELLRASWAELALASAEDEIVGTAPPALLRSIRVRAGLRDDLGDPAASTPAAQPPPPRAPPLALTASFWVLGMPGARTAPLGGRLALDVPVLRELVIQIDLSGGNGSGSACSACVLLSRLRSEMC
jgi:hypothetical protein